jgi:hypothetical protein
VTNSGPAAGWYEDPTGVGELRYHDGTQWTEHVTIDGQQTTSPYGVLTVPAFTMSRLAQWRSEDEKAVAIVGPTGALGQFVAMIDGTPGYRFEDASGGTVLEVSKPSLKSSVEVLDPAGYLVGTITKIGRLRSRYDVTPVDGDATATVKLSSGATDEWELQASGARRGSVARTVLSPPDGLMLAGADYATAIEGSLDEQMQRLVLAIPLAIDILDTQVTG